MTKLICQCCREVRFEPPFDDFSVQRIPCPPSCDRMKAMQQGLPLEKLSNAFRNEPVPPKIIGMLGH